MFRMTCWLWQSTLSADRIEHLVAVTRIEHLVGVTGTASNTNTVKSLIFGSIISSSS